MDIVPLGPGFAANTRRDDGGRRRRRRHLCGGARGFEEHSALVFRGQRSTAKASWRFRAASARRKSPKSARSAPAPIL